jgi:hypothetical protein
VVKTGETAVVFCIVCFAQHDKHPAEREDTWNGRQITGVWAKDYTYYNDFYKGGGYGPICLDHDRDEISEKKAADFDNDYKNNGLSL